MGGKRDTAGLFLSLSPSVSVFLSVSVILCVCLSVSVSRPPPTPLSLFLPISPPIPSLFLSAIVTRNLKFPARKFTFTLNMI